MTAKGVWFVECDARNSDGRLCMNAVGDHHSAADARAYAKILDWTRGKGRDRDLCPEHST